MSKNLVTPKTEPVDIAAIRGMMANAHKQIQARKQELNFISPDQQRLAELKERIAGRMGQLVPNALEERDRPVHVTIDKEGRTIDTITGEVLQIPNRIPTLKANLRTQKKEIIKQEQPKSKPAKEVVIEHPGLDASAAFFDARIGTHPAVRNRRQFTFNEQGKYIEKADRERKKARLDKLQAEISKGTKTTGVGIDNKVAIIQPKKFFSELDIPDIEWWDAIILQQNDYSSITSDTNVIPMLTGITQLIEHPIQLKPPYEPNKPILLPTHLTKHEQRKLRRQTRGEAMKVQQEKIRLGLAPAPEPKVKISNLMRVLTSDAVQDPTKVEQYVRNQMAQRLKTHEETNAARKLTPDQRREKKNKRAHEDIAHGVHAYVYRVKNLDDPAHRFKVETNCKQLQMTGCVIQCKDINIIVVEGGPKQQKKFRHLLLNRIKWNKTIKSQIDDDDDGEDQGNDRNRCVLLWQGTVKDRAFGEIKFKQCPTENFAREHFRRHGVEHYWDIGNNEAILEASTT